MICKWCHIEMSLGEIARNKDFCEDCKIMKDLMGRDLHVAAHMLSALCTAAHYDRGGKGKLPESLGD